MTYFHYQCAQCYCTLYRPNVPEGAECTSVVNCQRRLKNDPFGGQIAEVKLTP